MRILLFVCFLFYMDPVNRLIQLFVTHLLAIHECARTHIGYCAGNRIPCIQMPMDLLSHSAYTACCMDLLRLPTLLIGVLLDFDVSHVIDSALPLNAYGAFCQCSFVCNKLTSTVTNKFCTCIEARSCEEY